MLRALLLTACLFAAAPVPVQTRDTPDQRLAYFRHQIQEQNRQRRERQFARKILWVAMAVFGVGLIVVTIYRRRQRD